jgi:hypothetical protein
MSIIDGACICIDQSVSCVEYRLHWVPSSLFVVGVAEQQDIAMWIH